MGANSAAQVAVKVTGGTENSVVGIALIRKACGHIELAIPIPDLASKRAGAERE